MTRRSIVDEGGRRVSQGLLERKDYSTYMHSELLPGGSEAGEAAFAIVKRQVPDVKTSFRILKYHSPGPETGSQLVVKRNVG
jgi:hypothetical protein